jgi:hypothetical protein
MSDRERARRGRQQAASEGRRTASSIDEVCARNDVCRDFIYGQIRAGRPKATKFGRVTRIFSDDEEAWQNSLPKLGAA